MLLGVLAAGKSDAQVETWRDELTGVANALYDHLQAKVRTEHELIEATPDDILPGFEWLDPALLKRDELERIRWIAYNFNNTDDAQREGEE